MLDTVVKVAEFELFANDAIRGLFRLLSGKETSTYLKYIRVLHVVNSWQMAQVACFKISRLRRVADNPRRDRAANIK